jgi:predicted extracellular nuclease
MVLAWVGDQSSPKDLRAQVNGGILISETLISHEGVDDTEFIELSGKPQANLTGLSLLVIDGRPEEAGVIRRRFDLKPAHQLGRNGKFLIGNAEGLQRRFRVNPDAGVAQDYLPNHPITIALVTTESLHATSQAGSSDSSRKGRVGQRIRGDEVVLDAVAFGETEQATRVVFDAPLVLSANEYFPAGAERHAGDTGGRTKDAWKISSFNFGRSQPLHTPMSSEQAAEGPLAIYEIQSDGFLSPYEGEYRKTTGIVTAVAHQGFYLQDPDGDENPATSDGIYVFTGRNDSPPKVGDRLVLSAWIEEFIPGGRETQNLSITQLKSPTIHEKVINQQVPAAVVIGTEGRQPPATEMFRSLEGSVDLNSHQAREIQLQPTRYGLDFFESLEGMLVCVRSPVCISASRVYGKFNSEVFVVVDQGQGVLPKEALTRRGVLKLQPHEDNRGDQNPERIQIQFDASPDAQGTLYPSPAPRLHVGDQLDSVSGVVGYGFGNFEVNVTESVKVTSGGIKQEVTSLVGDVDHLTLAGYNVLNLSADQEDDDQRQLVARQIVHQLRSPDIVALQEIQDDSGERDDGVTQAERTLRKLVDAIRDAGGPLYESINVPPVDGKDGGVPGGNIRNAFLFNPARVKLIRYEGFHPEKWRSLGVSDPFAFEGARTPLCATFTFQGHELTLVNNHLTSRYGSSPIAGALQPFVQGGSQSRTRQADALNEWVNLSLDQSPATHLVILGDMNTFEFTRELAQNLTRRRSKLGLEGRQGPVVLNLIEKTQEEDRYSYIFEGNAQALDHCFVTPDLFQNAEFDIVHVNTGFHRDNELSLQRNVASDHEPILARFRLPKRR